MTSFSIMRNVASLSGALAILVVSVSAQAQSQHGLSVFGDLKYPADFTHFEYTNPAALKGGAVTQGTIGTFDNLNPFVLKGVSAAGAAGIYDTLTVNADDEPFSVYGLLAESMEVAEDKSWVQFNLRKEAQWHDGEPLTADDVVWTFNTLISDGHPFYRSYYSAVDTVEAVDPHTVKFSFNESDNAELPLIIGQLAILPRHFWEGRDFNKTTLDPLLGSGPYQFDKIDAGRSISYKRVENYWGAAVPVNVGKHNFDRLKYDYYRDLTVALEAFKAGDIDFRQEFISKNWVTAYDFPAINEGRVKREEIPDQRTQRMQAYIFNMRKSKFSDPRVRQALGYAFDFEWLNKNIFYGAYERTHSYFQNSEMQATGVPEGDELALLEPYRDQLPESVFTDAYELPQTDGSGNLRKQYREALKLLKAAGWTVKGGKLTNTESGEVMTMELIIAQPSIEKLGLAYKKALERLGVDLKVRVIDSAQYQKRVEEFDFDLIVSGWQQSRSPGNEQADYWGSAAADDSGSRNYGGIKNPVIDELIKKVVGATSREEQVLATKAMDRVLLHHHYVIPQYFGPTYRVAFWDKFERPEIAPQNTLGFDTWWVNPDMAEAIDQ